MPEAAIAPQSDPKIIELRQHLATAASHVDLDARTIKKVILLKVGEAEGHGFYVDKQFIHDCYQYIVDEMAGRVQCNAGHNYENLFLQLGAFSNVTFGGNKITADLKVYEAADKSPRGELGSWVLNIANEDPEAVQCSIRYIPGNYYQFNEKNEKVILPETYWGPPKAIFEGKKIFQEFKALKSCDIVDDGALTDRLFSKKDNSIIQQFQSILSDFKKLFHMSTQKNDTPVNPQVPQTTLSTETTPVAEPPKDLSAELKDQQLKLIDKDKEVQQLQSQIDALNVKITELENTPTVDPSGAQTDEKNLSSTPEEAWMGNPITQKALRNQGK